MRFLDRREAGERLAAALIRFRAKPKTVVLGLPRGGVVTAAAVAGQLGLPLDIVCPRKIGAPFNPEYAIGAVTETGEAFLNERVIAQLGVDPSYLKRTIAEQSAEAQRRLAVYRQGRPARNFEGSTAILVDDGIATGATMKAAIRSMRTQKAAKIIVAVPVLPPDHIQELTAIVDGLYYLAAPPHFAAVGQFYERFESTSDAEVMELLKTHSMA
jgi:putative phosphoribosyl transferase